jgi:hypothetical protein
MVGLGRCRQLTDRFDDRSQLPVMNANLGVPFGQFFG